ncbi:MAG TPA: hypothetical protein VKB34_01095 [Povalibacter sp.]|nr:hypothetical protein [Povalibacter sp.]
MVATLGVWAGICAMQSLAADPIATMTIADGQIRVIQGAHRYAGVAGMRIAPETIVETGERAFAQLESGIRTQLGPQTRLLISSGKGTSLLQGAYLLSGWLKIDNSTNAPLKTGTATVEITALDGTLIAWADRERTMLFIESGTAQIVERGAAEALTTITLAANRNYQRQRGKPGVRGTGAGLLGAELPTSFHDALPDLVARFASVQLPPQPDAGFSYADVRDWLVLDANVRKRFARLWRSRVHDEDFRAGLIADLRWHPEWHDLLFPPPPPELVQRDARIIPVNAAATGSNAPRAEPAH